MVKAKTGIVTVASQYESGGERAEELLVQMAAALEEQGVQPVAASRIVWDGADAVDVCRELKEENVDSLTVILSTWVTDSLLYVLVHEMNLPVLLWAVPYTETFSIGCVQHFGSILKTHKIPYDYAYGLADQEEAVKKAVLTAETGRIIKAVKNMKLALIGPRQTWRVAGPQDMTNEEWEFSEKFGVTILHVEMEEIIEAAGKIDVASAMHTYKALEKRTGDARIDEETKIHMARIYMVVKEIVKKYSLDAIAAECYPFYSGLMNLPSSWLADEGLIVDTEGDIGHAVVMYMLNLAARGGACALGEVGKIDAENNILQLAHEGSTAHSLAQSLEDVQISPSGENGCFVGLPLKKMDGVTVSSIQGNGRDGYQILIEKGSVEEAGRQEWVEGGKKLLVKLRVENAQGAVDGLIEKGMDHHLIVKEGDYTEIMTSLCKYLEVKKETF